MLFRSGEEGAQQHQHRLLQDIHRIRKRLGSERADRVGSALVEAFSRAYDVDAHQRWIEILLTEYYDPMYRYQMERRGGAVLFRGTRAEVLEKAGEMAC